MIPHPTMRTNRIVSKPMLWLALFALFATPSTRPALSQNVAATPDAQRNALNAVRSQARSLYNATQIARNYGDNGVQIVWEQFQLLRNRYNAFTATLSPSQAAKCGNEWAELSAGLDIIQQVFGKYRQDLAAGRTTATAVSDMCRVLYEAGHIWLLEFNRTALQAHAG